MFTKSFSIEWRERTRRARAISPRERWNWTRDDAKPNRERRRSQSGSHRLKSSDPNVPSSRRRWRSYETAKTELEETRARERELDEKEAQLERREEAAVRQLSAAAEAEVILNEENAKLEQKLHELAPNLLAAELEREIVDLKMELNARKRRRTRLGQRRRRAPPPRGRGESKV